MHELVILSLLIEVQFIKWFQYYTTIEHYTLKIICSVSLQIEPFPNKKTQCHKDLTV